MSEKNPSIGTSATRRGFLTFAAAGAVTAGIGPLNRAYAQEIRLTAGSSHPPVVPWVTVLRDHIVPESAKRAAAAGYPIRWTEAYGGALYNFQNTLKGVADGLADVGWVGTLWETNTLPLQNVTFHAPFGSVNTRHVMEIGNEITATIPAVNDAWTRHNQIHLGSAAGDGYVILTKRPLETVEDLRGLRMMTPGALALWLNNTGAIGIDGGLPVYYNNIQTGLADGAILPGSGVLPFKIHEVAPYLTQAQLGAPWAIALTINRRTYDRLPPEVQKIMEDLGRDYSELVTQGIVSTLETHLAQLRTLGVKMSVMARDEQIKWARTVPNLAGEWVRRNEERGLPAKQVLLAYMEGQRKRGDTPLRDWDKEI